MVTKNLLKPFLFRSLLASGALLGAAGALGCQPAAAKAPDEASSGGSSSAAAAPLAPSNPHAQDEQAAHVRADAWLALIDQEEFAQSWDSAAPLFKSSVKSEDWGNAVRNARKPLGALSSRKFRATEYKTSLPGAPDGEYVVVYYDTSFAQKQSAREIVTLMKTDGDWRVAGYFVQ
ncbi:MAG TPA: DUF4019 domain-containing protein [Polyangiaceae bacterium]|nr:DUF4019 domain-containing protein [Polyangiaceae bacterium]